MNKNKLNNKKKKKLSYTQSYKQIEKDLSMLFAIMLTKQLKKLENI
ncbi:MAG: hypothetical protein HGB12_16755 [Bacteroidetes bacterium]|nr:hypothetical protein [Bacteroidota bacterium]